MLKYIVAFISALFIFATCFILCGLVTSMLIPFSWSVTIVAIGPLDANIASLLSLVLSSIAATMTFKASLTAKTGKLSRKSKGYRGTPYLFL